VFNDPGNFEGIVQEDNGVSHPQFPGVGIDIVNDHIRGSSKPGAADKDKSTRDLSEGVQVDAVNHI
jgi:hypothetical protein